jgi:LPXTG-site transpeptidase (sortase) family protein
MYVMLMYTVPNAEGRLRQINYSLLFLVVIINLYVFVAPFSAQIFAWTDRYTGKQDHLQRTLKEPDTLLASKPARPNHIIIPAMLTDSDINEGTNARDALNKGIWRWPSSSTPDRGGNTVLLGTRFSYIKPKSEFYFMDRLRLGSPFGIVWNGKTYRYKVVNIANLQPNDASVLAQTKVPTVTLYTTTPLIYATGRLAVTAQLETKP